MHVIPLRLKKDHDRRLRAGHCWIYSNEIDTGATPFKGIEPGQPVEIYSYKEKWLGSGYINPHTLICVRLVSRDRKHPLSGSLIVHRLKIALSLRNRLYQRPFYRLVFGESDGLPGLVVDRFGHLIVIQITTAGMERMKPEIISAVEKVLRPSSILFRNDVPIREIEGLERYVEPALGSVPARVELDEHGVRFFAPLQGGQKTGWYFDQARNRSRLPAYVQGGRVLDLCSYVGAWGVQAAVAGAAEVTCVDSSRAALEMVESNAALNSVSARVKPLRGDLFDLMKQLLTARERFDLVLLDPPAFIKRKKDLNEGMQAYWRLNEMALRLTAPDGILITSSCSYHLENARLLQLVQQAARHSDKSLQLLELGHQAPDHPVHPAIPETAYLKTFFLRVLPAF